MFPYLVSWLLTLARGLSMGESSTRSAGRPPLTASPSTWVVKRLTALDLAWWHLLHIRTASVAHGSIVSALPRPDKQLPQRADYIFHYSITLLHFMSSSNAHKEGMTVCTAAGTQAARNSACVTLTFFARFGVGADDCAFPAIDTATPAAVVLRCAENSPSMLRHAPCHKIESRTQSVHNQCQGNGYSTCCRFYRVGKTKFVDHTLRRSGPKSVLQARHART